MLKNLFKRNNKSYKVAMEQIDFEIEFYLDQREHFVEVLADASNDEERAKIQKSIERATIAQQAVEDLQKRIKINVYES